MELIAWMARYSNGSGVIGMLELAMTSALSREKPAIVVQHPQEVANFHLVPLADGVFGEAGLSAIGGLAEEEAGGTVLRVGLEFVGDVRWRRARDVMAM